MSSPTPAPTPTRSNGNIDDDIDLQHRKDPKQMYQNAAAAPTGMSAGRQAGISSAAIVAGLLRIECIAILLKKSNAPRGFDVGVLEQDGSAFG